MVMNKSSYLFRFTQPIRTKRTDTVDWGLGGGRKKGKKQAEEAARTNRRRTKKRMAAELSSERLQR